MGRRGKDGKTGGRGKDGKTRERREATVYYRINWK